MMGLLWKVIEASNEKAVSNEDCPISGQSLVNRAIEAFHDSCNDAVAAGAIEAEGLLKGIIDLPGKRLPQQVSGPEKACAHRCFRNAEGNGNFLDTHFFQRP